MKQTLLTILRDKNIDTSQFRKASNKLAFILAGEVGSHLEKEKTKITTPMGQAEGQKIKNDVIIIPILRAALSILPPFLRFFEEAKVGFLGLKRDEKTAIANIYYKNLPEISSNDDIIILDPMIATGGSGTQAIQILKENGAKEEKIIFTAVICATEGILKIKKAFPKVKIICVQEDNELNKEKFIVPGLGDFGDRYFGTL